MPKYYYLKVRLFTHTVMESDEFKEASKIEEKEVNVIVRQEYNMCLNFDICDYLKNLIYVYSLGDEYEEDKILYNEPVYGFCGCCLLGFSYGKILRCELF